MATQTKKAPTYDYSKLQKAPRNLEPSMMKAGSKTQVADKKSPQVKSIKMASPGKRRTYE